MWIFAGYKKPLETLFEHNEGLPSRFPQRFIFEDYTDSELKQIIEDMMEYMPPQLSKKNGSGAKQKKTKAAPSSYNNYSSRRMYPPQRPTQPGETKTCRFGLTWTYVDYLGEKSSSCSQFSICLFAHISTFQYNE